MQITRLNDYLEQLKLEYPLLTEEQLKDICKYGFHSLVGKLNKHFDVIFEKPDRLVAYYKYITNFDKKIQLVRQQKIYKLHYQKIPVGTTWYTPVKRVYWDNPKGDLFNTTIYKLKAEAQEYSAYIMKLTRPHKDVWKLKVDKINEKELSK